MIIPIPANVTVIAVNTAMIVWTLLVNVICLVGIFVLLFLVTFMQVCACLVHLIPNAAIDF